MLSDDPPGVSSVKFDVLIIGGGIAGLAFAAALRDSSRRIGVVEGCVPVKGDGWDVRIYAISPGSAAFLERIACWRQLDASRIALVEAMDISGDRGGRLHFTAYQARTDALAWIVEASALAGELWQSIRRQSNLSLFCPRRPASLQLPSINDDGPAVVDLDDGTRLTADLVVGADGRDSWVRKSSRLHADDHPYDELGVVANFKCSREHSGRACQWFRRDGVLALLPLPGKRLSMVWSAPEVVARELLASSAATLADRVGRTSSFRHGRLDAISAPLAIPLRHVTVPQIIARRVALIGDAAHGIHPLSGHGINLGLADARELSRIIGELVTWRDVGEAGVLRRYQRARREQVLMFQQTTHALHSLFLRPAPTATAVRNFGLSFVDRLPFAKSVLARYAID